MEYSKDIVLGINYVGKSGQANLERRIFVDFWKKYRILATISFFCGILIVLDCMLMYSFIQILQNYALLI